jgi:hypothetical protein
MKFNDYNRRRFGQGGYLKESIYWIKFKYNVKSNNSYKNSDYNYLKLSNIDKYYKPAHSYIYFICG